MVGVQERRFQGQRSAPTEQTHHTTSQVRAGGPWGGLTIPQPPGRSTLQGKEGPTAGVGALTAAQGQPRLEGSASLSPSPPQGGMTVVEQITRPILLFPDQSCLQYIHQPEAFKGRRRTTRLQPLPPHQAPVVLRFLLLVFKPEILTLQKAGHLQADIALLAELPPCRPCPAGGGRSFGTRATKGPGALRTSAQAERLLPPKSWRLCPPLALV